jgi:thiol-disulfide isomerase/thioredoxin
MRKKACFLLTFLAISFLFTPTPGLGQEAPEFSLSDIYGQPLRLSDFEGKVILLDFWATWCPFCRESIPILKSLYEEYKNKGLVIIGIALEYDQGQTLKRFAKEKKISYPLAVGKERLATEYSAYGVPTRILLNRTGKIVEKFVGFQDKEVLESAIQDFL